MAEREKLVGKASEFKDGDRRIVFLGNTEVGIFRDKGEYYAYSNYCLIRPRAGSISPKRSSTSSVPGTATSTT